MDLHQNEEDQDNSHVDWAYLPPTAMHVIGTLLPSSSLLRARTVNRHWANCLAGVVDTLYIVPEYFLKDETAQEAPKVFPKAVTVNLDLQDTFMAVPEAVKDSLERYTSQRSQQAGQPAAQEASGSEASTSGAVPHGDSSGDEGSESCVLGCAATGLGDPTATASSAERASAAGPPAGPSTSNPPAVGEQRQGAQPEQQREPAQVASGEQEQQQGQQQQAEQHPPPQDRQEQQALPQQQPHPQQPQQLAQVLIDGPAGVVVVAVVPGDVVHGIPGAPAAAAPAGAAAAAAPGVPQPAPTFPYSAIPVEPLPSIVPAGMTHLRVRLPDTHDMQCHFADMPSTWDYASSLLSRVGPKLNGLSLSTAPDAAHISMLSPLTQLTSLTMDEASHSTWSAEHLPIIGSLTNLCSLAVKIPPFRNPRPDPAVAAAQQQPPSPLASWTGLQRLTKLHVSALRYTFHASLVSVLPSLTKLEYLALRAPQTRLPWPGTDRPLFANIGALTGLTQLSLALGDHTMMPLDWQALTALGRLSAIEISVSEGSDGLNVPTGVDFPALRNLKLRYPNSQDLVRIAGWSGICKLDIKFPEHEREWHQEDAVVELLDFRTKLPPTPGSTIIAAALDNAPAALSALSGGAAGGGAADGATAAAAAGVGNGLGQLMGGIAALNLGHTTAPAAVAAGAAAAIVAGGATATTAAGGGGTAPTGAGNTAGLTVWWSPLLPLLALPNMTDFRCSAKEGLASREPILFDAIVAGLCTAWPGITRLCFKGCISVASQAAGWDALKALTKLQQLELRHHPPLQGDENQDAALALASRNPRYLRVDPIKLPATSLPDSLQTLLLENVELRRKETDCLGNLTSLERRTTCRHFPEFVGMPLQRLVVSNCCVKAKGISSIAKECAGLTHLVFAVYKVTEQADMRELQVALKEMVTRLKLLQVLKVRVLAGCITQELVEDMVIHLPHLQRLKLTSSDGWSDTALFLPLTRMSGLRKCSLAYFKSAEAARLLRQEFRLVLPYCKIKAKQETSP